MQGATNIYPRDLDTHLLRKASLGEAVGLVVQLELGFEDLDLMFGKPGLRFGYVLMMKHQGWVVLLGEEGVPVGGHEVLLVLSSGMPYWVSWVHVRLTALLVLHVHVWMVLSLFGVEAVLFLLVSSFLFLLLCLSGYKRQGVLVVKSLAVKGLLSRLIS
jgi:hypothetical protein